MYATPKPLRRAFTTPARLNDDNGTHQALNLEAERSRIHGNETTTDDEMQQTLFHYPAGKVVKLNLSVPSGGSGSSPGFSASVVAPGTIPWTSARESLMAVGPLRFYRTAATNIAFLTCGRAASPFLLSVFPKKTQCWCVDGETKFVIQVGQNNFYRIELLDERKEEVAAELKSVLPDLLQFETTACPFQRNFTVELPEQPSTPVRKRPWKPREPQTAIEILPGTRERERNRVSDISSGSPSVDNKKEDIMVAAAESSDEYASAVETGSVSDSSVSSEPSPSGFTPRAPRILLYDDDDDDAHRDILATPTKPLSISNRRSATAPLRLKLENLPQSSLRHSRIRTSESSASSANTGNELLPSSSADSFFSFHSPISPTHPSTTNTTPPSPGHTGNDLIVVPKIRHSRDISDVTITSDILRDTPGTQPSTAFTSDAEPLSPLETKESSVLDGGEWAGLMTPPPSTRRARIRRQTSERDFSPMPSATNLTSAPNGVHIGALVLQKTCSIMLGPSHTFLSFMLGVAAKIATGAIHGVAYPFNKDGGGTTTAADWGYCSEDEGLIADWMEDDYGISLDSKTARKGTPSNDWSLD